MSAQNSALAGHQRLLAMRSILDLPFAHAFALDPQLAIDISGVARLSELNAKNVAIVDSLRSLAHTNAQDFYAIDDAAEALGTALRMAISSRQLLWLSSLPHSDVERVRNILGGDIVHVVGPELTVDKLDESILELPDAMKQRGEPLVPIAISPTELVQTWAHGTREQQKLLAYLLEGTNTLVMQQENLHALRKVGTKLIERNPVSRLLYNPKVLAYLVVMVYSSLRALPVVFVPGFHGNVWVLWGIDIITAIPYTWGIVEMITGRSFGRRMLGLLITLVTFVSPYVYFWANGRDYPVWVTIFVIALIVAACAVEYVRWLRDRAISAILRQPPTICR
ncbi:hypothetical protein HMPREF3042_04315 [Corynebacterium sp. HMSC074C05]|uniref:hypothetical protein n=1 Tax=Corynebacterium sp. HMSC074C05 TaxID=1739534 RepID=UPI0008AA4377|nr:hypothetical protein [Corynebacterium sp. HMSC074C05]OHR33602.1 hypothetical protein HMPREF3042_04315 [Corynebacterium sp. HMSC074C05]